MCAMLSLLMIGTLVGFSMLFQPVLDPYLLEIGRKGTVQVGLGLTNTRTGKPSTPDEVAVSARGISYVFVGEQHGTVAHQQMQADIIRALVRDGRNVSVGFEMFTRPNQLNLNPWTLGKWTEAEFVEKANWKKEWGFDYASYRPIFEAVKELRLPMVALNVPRAWVSAVGKGGPGALTAEQQQELPELYLDNKNHQAVFNSLMGGHPVSGDAGRNMYAAMVLWDEGMADTAIKYTSQFGSSANRVMVILAGIGHGMYEQGINWRIARRTGQETLTVICIQADGPRKVARGLGEFVFASKP